MIPIVGPPPTYPPGVEAAVFNAVYSVGAAGLLTMATENAIHNKFMQKRPEESRVNGNRVIKSNLVRGACIVTAAAVGISVGAIGIPVLTTFVTTTCWCYGLMITATGVINTTKWLFDDRMSITNELEHLRMLNTHQQ